MCKAHSDPIFIFKMEGRRGEEIGFLFSSQGPLLWSSLRATAGFQQGCPQRCGMSPLRATLIWVRVLVPSNWSLLLTPVPREQDHSSLWLKESNFKTLGSGQTEQKGQILATSKTKVLEKRVYSECRGQQWEEMISPSFSSSCNPELTPGFGAWREAVTQGSSHFTLRQGSQSCLISTTPSRVISSKQITSLKVRKILGYLLISQMAFICLGVLLVL